MSNGEEDENDDVEVEIEIDFFPLPLEADSLEIDDDGNFRIGITMDEAQMEDFIERVKEFNRLRDAQDKGEQIEFLDGDDQEPIALDYLE